MTPPRLFHLSEVGNIEVFAPRPVEVPSQRGSGQEWLNGALVWAVDEARQAAYFFPRDCPRILLWPTEETSDSDRAGWFADGENSMIACVQADWLARIEKQVLFRYELPDVTFRSIEDGWMWVSHDAVAPIQVNRIDDLVDALRSEEVELRVMDSLVPLRDVWQTSLHASGIRLRNAANWVEV